jgi:hypothetical protein
MTFITSNEPDTRDRVVYPNPGDLGGEISDIEQWMTDPAYTALFMPADTIPLNVLNPDLFNWAMQTWVGTGIPPEFHSVSTLTPIEWAALPTPVTPAPTPPPFYATDREALLALYTDCQESLTRGEKNSISPTLAQVGTYLGLITPQQLPAP